MTANLPEFENRTGQDAERPGGAAPLEGAHPIPDMSGGETDLAPLVARMRAGDREAVAEFVARYGEIVRRRARWRLHSSVRRMYDSQDVLSTVSRRLDSYVRTGRMAAVTQEQWWALVASMANRAVIDQQRKADRRPAAPLEGETPDPAVPAPVTLERAETAGLLNDSAETLLDDTDREILRLWRAGKRHDHIAGALSLSHAAVRKRWERLCARLRDRLTLEETP